MVAQDADIISDDPPEVPDTPGGVRADQETINAHVSEYQMYRRQDLLHRVIVENLPYVHAIVSRVNYIDQPALDHDDLVQAGLIGLLYAINKWDAAKNVPFRSFAFLRIRGSVIDAIRAVSSTSRWRNVQYIQLEDVYTAPEDDDAEAIGVSKATSDKLRSTLLKLPLRQAMVLLLGINGLPVKSIATLLEVSSSQVQKDRQRGLQRLHSELLDSMSD